MKTRTLFIVRGLPGSGKTTLARLISERAMVAADDFFETEDGYAFDPTKIGEAHQWCQDMVRAYMEDGEDRIVVHNTFSQPWEAQFYFDLADSFGYSVFVIECQNRFDNTHAVPPQSIDAMRARWLPLDC